MSYKININLDGFLLLLECRGEGNPQGLKNIQCTNGKATPVAMAT